jgi:GAF domain-containing protein
MIAAIYNDQPAINWAGLYYVDEFEKGAWLGPFQGKPACTWISKNEGVIGFTLREQYAVNIYNVHEFPGHIACDSASASEMVIPLLHEGKIRAVLDIDSTEENFFSEGDLELMIKIAGVLQESAFCIKL